MQQAEEKTAPKPGSKAAKKAAEERAQKAEEARVKAKKEALLDSILCFQPARPVIVSRTETDITLNLAKRGTSNSVSILF